jgi:hypothetical protein
LRRAAEPLLKSGYGEYLLNLLKDGSAMPAGALQKAES